MQFYVGHGEMLDTSTFGRAYVQTRLRRTSVAIGAIDLLVQQNSAGAWVDVCSSVMTRRRLSKYTTLPVTGLHSAE
jgi:hypothetical protein